VKEIDAQRVAQKKRFLDTEKIFLQRKCYERKIVQVENPHPPNKFSNSPFLKQLFIDRSSIGGKCVRTATKTMVGDSKNRKALALLCLTSGVRLVSYSAVLIMTTLETVT